MKTKSILFKVKLSGNGIVNFDSNEQKWMFQPKNNNDKPHRLFSKHNNVNYSKKNFYRDEEGNLTYKLKISSECIKKAMFGGDYIAQTPNIVHNDAILHSYITSPISHLRGYLFASKTKTGTLKRKGAITMCDAEQVNDAVSYLDVASVSGGKVDESKSEDQGENNFYYHENVGHVDYESMGHIDLSSLKFVSCDQIFDRRSFSSDNYAMYKMFMAQHFPGFDSELEYHKMKGSTVNIPELGITIGDGNVVRLVKEALKRLLMTEIRRKNALVRTVGLSIKLVNDPTVDTFGSEEGWVELNSVEDIDRLDFEVEDFYTVVEKEEATKLLETIKEELKSAKKENEDKTAAKRNTKKDSK